MTITETTSTTGEQGRHQPKGLSMGQDLPCSTAPAVGSEVGCRVVQPSAVGSDGQAVPQLTASTAWAPVVAPNRRHSRDGGDAGLPQPPHPFPPPSRLFEYRGRVSPVPRVVPVKRPRVTIPLVRRMKATLPVKLFARSAAIANSSAKLKREYVRGCSRTVWRLVCIGASHPQAFTHGARCSQGKP